MNAFWNAMAATATIAGANTFAPAWTPRVSPRSASPRTRNRSADCTRSNAFAPTAGPARCASSQARATAAANTGMDQSCAAGGDPPFATCAASSTRFPVMWAVKMLPRLKKPVTSTGPATTLRTSSSVMSRAGKGAGSCARRSACASMCFPFSVARRGGRPDALREKVRGDEAEPHCEQDEQGSPPVPKDDGSQGGGRFFAELRDLDEAACHPEEKDARDERDDCREAERGEWQAKPVAQRRHHRPHQQARQKGGRGRARAERDRRGSKRPGDHPHRDRSRQESPSQRVEAP